MEEEVIEMKNNDDDDDDDFHDGKFRIITKLIGQEKNHHIRVNDDKLYQLESELFHGCIVLRVAGLSNTPQAYFKEKRRKYQLLIQGKFKVEGIKFSDLVTGQLFSKPFSKYPNKYVLSTVVGIISLLAPYLEIDVYSKQPHMLSPLVYTAQTFREDPLDSAPSPLSEGASVEFNRLGTNSSKRKKNLNPKLMDEMEFLLDKMYTFQFYDHMLDIPQFTLDFGYGLVAHLDEYLNSQAIQIMSYRKSTKEFGWLVEIHKN